MSRAVSPPGPEIRATFNRCEEVGTTKRSPGGCCGSRPPPGGPCGWSDRYHPGDGNYSRLRDRRRHRHGSGSGSALPVRRRDAGAGAGLGSVRSLRSRVLHRHTGWVTTKRVTLLPRSAFHLRAETGAPRLGSGEQVSEHCHSNPHIRVRVAVNASRRTERPCTRRSSHRHMIVPSAEFRI